MTYGTGSSVNYVYDNLGRVLAVHYNGEQDNGYSYTYTGNGALGKLTDADNNRSISYGYDGLNRLITMTEYAGTSGVQQYRTDYDDANRLSKLEYKVSPSQNGSFTDVKAYTYTYNNADGSLSAMTMPYGHYDYAYDALKRISTKTLGASNSSILTKAYSYCNSFTDANFTASLIAGFQNRNSSGGVIDNYSYTYDSVGNITSITDKNSNIVYYTYDNQGQLLTETRGGVTYAYTYDTVGNLLAKSDGTSTDLYVYGNDQWKDLMTAYNGSSISYDAIGNPTQWYDGTNFTWAKGRQLASATNSSTGLNNAYTYNSDGLRLTKTVGTTQHKYLWQGSTLVSEYYDGKTLELFYDESGAPYAFSYKASNDAAPVVYYYVTNLQGDVTSIIDASSNIVAEYT